MYIVNNALKIFVFVMNVSMLESNKSIAHISTSVFERVEWTLSKFMSTFEVKR